MPGFLRQSTASQSRALGPFLDDTDFKTAETGLTIANTDIKLIVNGAASADKNSGGGTHRANGVYGVTFDATDTATVGELEVSVVVSGALPVFDKFVVVEEAVYDGLFAASAPGYLQPTTAGRTLDVSATGEAGIDWANVGAPTTTLNLSGTTIGVAAALTANNDKTGYRLSATGVDDVWDEAVSGHTTAGTTGKQLQDIATGTPPTAAAIRTEIDSNSTQLAAIAGYLDTEVAAIKAKTDTLPAAPAAVGDIPTAIQNADALLKRDLSAVAGEAARSPLNALRWLRNKWTISSGTLTVYKEDDSTSAWSATTTQTAGNPVTGSDPA